jgi:DNA-binding transcriptional MerR regulator
MEYRVEELARQAGVRVDTIRFYQGRGLLPAPARRGRVAIYEEGHLERLRRIRAWQREGLSLGVIKRLLEAGGAGGHETLLRAIVQERLGGRTLSRAELAAESNVPEPLIRAVEAAGLVEAIRIGEEERFTEADLEMARAGLAILQAGFPLDELLQLAVQHAQHVQEMADRAIGLFDRHVREAEANGEQAPDAVAQAFRVLLPQVPRLVALHFQRSVVKRALERLARGDDAQALNAALAAVESSRLEVTWR